MSKPHPLDIYQGSTLDPMQVKYLNPDRTPVDITGYTARMQVRDPYDSSLMLDLSSGDGLTVDGPNGTVLVEITAAQTKTLTKKGVYSLEIVNGATVIELLRGPVNVYPEITQP